MFSGHDIEYAKWRQIFDECVDKMEIPDVDKQLQLEECLDGQARELVKNFGFGGGAYKAILDKLEKFYGGENRSYSAIMKEVAEFRPISEVTAAQLDKFVSLVESLVLRIKTIEKAGELGNGLLYQSLLQKLTVDIVLM
mgnify:CR=1 FL=1